MPTIAQLRAEYSDLVFSLSASLEADDENAFNTALDKLAQLRERRLFVELRRMTVDLQGALERFQLEARLVDLAEQEVPNAKHRLDHVLKLTDEAAHKTIDLVEQSVPIAARTAKTAAELLVMWQRCHVSEIASEISSEIAGDDFRSMLARVGQFLEATRHDTDTLRQNLSEMLLAQSYQDLSGQIIRGVMTLVLELERTLSELARLAPDDTPRHSAPSTHSRTMGPAVPGIDHGPAVKGQNDVDSLLSGLGI